MAEYHFIGQILKAVDYEEPKLFCKWSIQIGSCWTVVEGESEGQTAVAIDSLYESSTFVHPLDIHLATRSIQGWPKIHVEIYAVNALNSSWPVGFGFAHLPTQPGFHKIVIQTWKIAPVGFYDSLSDRFSAGGYTVSKSDLVYSGVERYKLSTQSAGNVIVEGIVVLRNFTKFGVEFQ